jgi:DNA-binding CsgD family transcriptional regulator/tetratricopeptide (TPR) repeat protein
MFSQHDVLCPTLVARESELNVARDDLERASRGNGRVTLIVGEAGVGKSRLLRAMIEAARASGFLVLRGASFESDRTIPYAALLDLLRGFAGAGSAARFEHVFADAAAELASFFPELRAALPGVTPSAPVDPEMDKRRLLHGMSQSVCKLADAQPLLLAFEDAHWSDDATLDLVLHLVRANTSRRLAIALTYRGEEVGPGLARLIAELERARVSTELRVERLARDEVGEMLGAIFGSPGTLGDDFLRRLYDLTEGNPFFVEETLKGLIVAGDVVSTPSGWRARSLERVYVPRTSVDAVRRRLAVLSARARNVASVAAVAGRRFDFTLLAQLTDCDEQGLLVLVKELIAAQLVVEESADQFAFRHALTREAIYAELLSRERIALHRRVAASLEQSGAESPGSVEALAYHTWEAGDWQRAAAYALRAARHAMALSAPREALVHLDRAFAAESSLGDVSTELYLARGRAQETLGEFQRAHESFAEALQRSRAKNDDRNAWEALHALGMLWAARDYDRAGDYRRQALDVSRALGDDRLVARSLNRVGNWHVNVESPAAGLPHHEEALGLFERLGDERGVAETLDLIAMSHHIAGDQRAAAINYERVVPLLAALDDRRGLANALTLLSLCGASHHVSSTTPFMTAGGREELAELRALRLTREIGWRAGEAFIGFTLADCLAWRGEYDRAVPMARDSLALAREIEHFQWTSGAMRLLGVILLEIDAPHLAREQLEAAHRIARELGSRVWIRWTGAPLAIARCRTGDAPAAAELLDGLLGPLDAVANLASLPLTLGERQLWIARAELALSRGEPGLALRIADARLTAEREAAGDNKAGAPLLSLLRAQALIALDRLDDALSALDVAHAECEVQSARPLLWKVEAARGHVFRIRRERRAARAAFDSARAVANELAAALPDEQWRAQFLERVDTMAPPPAPASQARMARDDFGGLTRRERDVARLVADGKSNKAIARELGIGERTVEGHVTNALAKLGFGSRAQLAAWTVDKDVSTAARPRNSTYRS